MRIDRKKLFISLAIPLVVGGFSSFLTSKGMVLFAILKKPFLSPPSWLFPVVWTALYTLMGIAFYRIWTEAASYERRRQALTLYGIQLGFNFFWSLIFFNLREYYFAFVWLVALWILIYLTKIQFDKIDKIAGYLLVPYLIWVTFAGYLNLGFAILN